MALAPGGLAVCFFRGVARVGFLALDRGQGVSDTVGHALGDRLLKSVAERLTGLVREGDTVARVGGDEFTLLLPEVERAEEVAEVAERVLDALRQPWVLNGHEFRITASIGIAMFPNDGEDADALLRNADTAMYRAKDQGKDNYKLYTPAMNARIAERLALENSLRHGLERGEFLVYYQPQVEIASGKIVGMDALVRQLRYAQKRQHLQAVTDVMLTYLCRNRWHGFLLAECKGIDLQQSPKPNEVMFKIGDRVDAQDPYGKWIPATFAEIRGRQTAQGFTEWEGFIDYEGWNDKYNEWIGFDSGRLAFFGTKSHLYRYPKGFDKHKDYEKSSYYPGRPGR